MELAMRHRTIFTFTLLGVLLTLPSAKAGDLPKESLLQRKGWVQFEVILGRITALNPRHHEKTASCGGTIPGEPHELASMRFESGTVSLNYEFVSEQRRVVIHLADNNEFKIEQIPADDSGLPTILFKQQSDGTVEFAIEQNAGEVRLSRPNLWQLLMSHPQECKEHLLPLIGLVRSNWHLDERAERVKDAMFRVAESNERPPVSELNRLVEALADESFRKRSAADKKLRSYGQAVLSFLDKLDLKQLEREQRRRVGTIRKDLICDRGDTPERVAMWLVDSGSAWLDLVNHDSYEKRQLATQHLGRIVESPIVFNPAADSDKRAAQLLQLRKLLVQN
jgi:hypothetical protein